MLKFLIPYFYVILADPKRAALKRTAPPKLKTEKK